MNDQTFDLIVFDMDGVLVDTSSVHARVFADIWKNAGVLGPPYYEIAGMSTADAIRKVVPAFSESQVQYWANFKQAKTWEYLAEGTVLFEDTVPCLQRLSDRGMRMALATSASPERAEWTLSHYQLTRFFSPVVTAGDLNRGKPFPDIYLAVMDRANAVPDRTLIVEDSLSGLEAGLASHAFVASVRTGSAAVGDRFVGKFADLLELLNHFGL